MSIIQKLSEGIVNRDMKKEGQALLTKWEATGLLEGLDTQQLRHNMARLLENQAKELLRESNSMSNGAGIEGFASVAFPIVRRVFAGLIANELVSVQPMSLPSGLIFFLDFVYGDELAGVAKTDPRFGNSISPQKSIYGTDQVASQITGGVSIVGETNKESLSGPRQQSGYAYASPTGSNAAITKNAIGTLALKSQFKLDGSVSEARAKLIQFDPDLLVSTDLGCVVFDLAETELASKNPDYNNLAAFHWDNAELVARLNEVTLIGAHNIAAGEAIGIRRLTKRVKATEAATGVASVRFVVTLADQQCIDSESDVAVALIPGGGTNVTAGKLTFPEADSYAEKSGGLGAINDFNYPLEGNGDIPEIDIKVDSIAITAQTKKLKAKWTPELGQDLNA